MLTRRDALRALVATGVGAAAGTAAYGFLFERHQLSLVTADVPIAGLPPAMDGFRIGLITDIHHSETVPRADVATAVTRLVGASPDMVVLGGDYVSFADRQFMQPVAELLKPLAAAPAGAYAVLGNHDDDRDMPAALAAQGFAVLKDQRTTVDVRGERLDVAGIRFWTKRPGDIARVLNGTGGTTLLLAHDPRRIIEAAALDVQAVLSGHTHGGQVALPLLGAVAGRKFPVLSGLASQDHTTLFVSRGVGTVYVPVRINCPPDVAVLTLRPVVAS